MYFYKSLVASIFLCSLCFVAEDVFAQQSAGDCKLSDDVTPISQLTTANELPDPYLSRGDYANINQGR